MFSKVSERQRSDSADTISKPTKHQKIELFTPTVNASYGLVSASSKSLQLIIRTEQQMFAGGSLSSSKVIISGFSAGIIAQAKQRQKQAVVPEAATTSDKCTSKNTPQWLLPQTIFFNGETVTLLLTVSAIVAVLVPLKFVLDLANSALDNVSYVKFTLFNYIPIVLAGIVIVQLTQQVQTQQHVALPLAPNGAQVYLVPPEVKVFLGQSKNSYLDSVNDQGSIVNVLSTSFSAEYDETYSECDAFDKRAKQSDALNDICFITSEAKWLAPVFHKVMGAVSEPLGAINPTAGMIARGVGSAAGMANKFL
ncbi:MAG: hypothetical protein EZS28_002605, partial [Streblomastix strix]